MATYRYTAKDMDAKKVTGKIEAANRNELVTILRGKDQYLLDVKDITQKEINSYKIKLKELSIFSREIGTMLSSGVSLIRAMSILVQREEKDKLKKIYLDMYTKLQRGFTLSTAMQEQGKAFPELMINMFRSGENSGHIDQVAMTMAVQYEKDHKMKSKLRNAMIYPIILLCAMLGVGIIVFTWIVPSFSAVFGDMELPLITQIVTGFSNMLTQYWYWFMIGLLIMVALITSILRNPKVRYKVDRAKLKMPLIGKLLRTIYTARFARTMCSLYTSGISIINALMIVRTTIGNTYLEEQFTSVVNAVRNGNSLSLSVQQMEGFDSKLASSIFIGEESGQLDDMLMNLADNFDYDAEMASQKLVTMMEPILIIVMAFFVAMVMLAVLLPVINLYKDPTSMG